MKHISRQFAALAVASILAACVPDSHAGDTKPLQKTDAIKLLTSMGYKDVTVGAVIPGFGGMGSSQSVAMVIGIAVRDGQVQKLEQVFTFDNEIGWFFHEFGTDRQTGRTTSIRLWTLAGYKELYPEKSN